MTVQTQFYNYQRNPKGYNWDAPPFETHAPATVAMRTYMENRWGLTWLGTHGDRPIVSGQSISTHAFGASPDMRYQDPGPGLFVCDTEIIPWLINTSLETGVQAIHHYRRSLIWRPPGAPGSDRPAGSDGWKVQPPGTQMGKAWALWLHIEFLDTRLDDGRSIEAKLSGVPPIINPPLPNPPVIIDPQPTPPVLIPGSTHVIDVNITTVRRGSTGGRVKKMQGLLNTNFGQSVAVDGNFGAQTEAALKGVQAFFGMTADGICGPKTWDVLFELPFN